MKKISKTKIYKFGNNKKHIEDILYYKFTSGLEVEMSEYRRVKRKMQRIRSRETFETYYLYSKAKELLVK